MIMLENPELTKPATVNDLYEGRDIFKSVSQQYVDVWSYFDSLTEKQRLVLQTIENDEPINYLENFIGRYILVGGIGNIYGETLSRQHNYFHGLIGELYKDEPDEKMRIKLNYPGGKGDCGVTYRDIDFISLLNDDLYEKLYHTKLFFTENLSSGLYPYKGFPLHPSPSDKSLIYLNEKFIKKINTWQTDWGINMHERRIF